MSTIFLMNGVLGPNSVVGIGGALLASWVANYIFGFILGRIMSGQTKFSMCGKFTGIFIYFMAFLVALLIIATFADPVMMVIDTLIAYVADWMVFDSMVVGIVNCKCTALRKWFSVRGFSN